MDAPSLPPANRVEGTRQWHRLEAGLLLIAAIFFALHFVHLRADFPNHALWMDWAKYTDEGWYGDAAIRHHQLGHWNVPGDFNPAAALPVWPLIEMALFRVTGVSVVAARALTVVIFGLCMVSCYFVVRRWSDGSVASRGALGNVLAGEPRGRSLAPALAVLLLSVSPFCFAFMRLAILEPLLILWTLAALLAASSAGSAPWIRVPIRENWRERKSSPGLAWTISLGMLLPVMVLTKTTGVFLFPAIFWLLWASTGYRVKPFLRVALVAWGVGASIWAGYYGLFVRRHYLVDYRYLFSANTSTGLTLATFRTVIHDAFFDTTWIGQTLFYLALLAVIGSVAVLCARRSRSNPLVAALLLWIFGYGAFLAYHANLQPRYYLVIAVPLTMLVAIAFDAVVKGAMATWSGHTQAFGSRTVIWAVRTMAVASGAALLFAAINGGRQTINFVRHPEYTFLSAARQVQDAVERELAVDPHHSRLLLSISGSDISLMTGIPSICDDFGTMTLPERVAAYKPGWFAAWNDVEDDKMDALSPMYRLVRVAAIPAYDDPERNLLILYRLDAVTSPGRPGRPGRRRWLSAQQRLRARLGAQPKPTEPKH